MKWETVPLSSIAEVVMGQSPPGSAYNDHEEGLPLITGAGQMGNRTPKAEKYTSEWSRIATDGDIIMCIRATIGDLNWANREYALGRGVAGIRPSQSFAPSYAWWVLIGKKQELERYATGSTFKQVKRKNVEELQIPLPPLEEQKRIAGILDAADILRAKRREALAKLDDLLQSTFLDMFGDPVTNPKGWEVIPLGNAFELKHGFAFKSEQFLYEGEYVLLTPGNFFEKGGFRDRGEKQRYHDAPVPEEYVLVKGDLLIAMTEQAPGLLGSPILVPDSNRFLHNQRLGKVVKKIKIDSLFIFHLMNAASIRARIQKDSTGTKVKHTSPKKIATINIGAPPLDLQQRFAEIVSSVEEQKAKMRKHLEQLDDLFASLQQRAFRGDL